MTNLELKGILKNKEIYVVDNGTIKVSKLKFFTVKNNKLINITKDIAEAGKLKTTAEGEIKETVIGMSRTFSVLYYVYSIIKRKQDKELHSFKYIIMS